ncbi:hypothetical protein [Brevundimonas viscosa]|uniref:DUF2927 domain-containing protein n=1 Tax=Brevundimonas viscosa TaxID=871741 RepID=A0A1I6SY24_9CAUL|nr:hypothetical protein [Brevundimonas viscosa]SFS81793.1 hypothetical protein SAMN05192570_2782 [Brevundimonas viscosa]
MTTWALAGAMAAAILQPQATAAAPPPQDPADLATTRLEDIVVDRRRLEEVVREFVGEVGAPPYRRGLARWHDRLCVGVANVRHDVGQAVVDRVSEVALELGLDIGEPGCTANVVIVFTTDGAALADAMVAENRRAFRIGLGGLDRGNPALRDFRTADRPVRWWHVSLPVNSNNGKIAVRMPGDVDPYGNPSAPVIAVFAASRLNSQIRDDLNKAMIVVDVDRLGGANLAQLADYVAFVALAQVDPDADTAAYDTVLNLFDRPAAVEGLTEWDRTYLTSLYRVQGGPVRRINPNAQADVMANDMARRWRAGQTAPEPAPE